MTTETLRHTPLIDEHRALGARLVPFAGWEMPIQYAGITKEHEAVRTRAGLFDVSHMGELAIRGEGAVAIVDRLITNSLASAADGQAVYTCCCSDRGGILDDLIVYRRSGTDVMVVCNASNREKIVEHFRRELPPSVDFQDESDATALMALQGPAALDVLAQSGAALAIEGRLGRFRFASGSLGDAPVTVARTGYTGEDGVEVFCPSEHAVAVWRAILDAGKGAGIVPVGLGARDTLRLEARLSLYGNELDEETHPLEAGLGWTVKLDKGDFIGRAAIQRAAGEAPRRTLVGFEMVGRGSARPGYSIEDEAGNGIGKVTSGGPSPTLGKAIGLAYVTPECSDVGTPLVMDCRGRKVAAKVVTTPFYKRPKGA